MKVYLLTYNASYAGEPVEWVKVYDSYNKAKVAMEEEIEQETEASTWFGDLLEDKESNVVQERTESCFEIYKDGEWLLYHARYEIIEKKVL